MNSKTQNSLAVKMTIHRIQRRPVGGTWINGTVPGYRFCALVFSEHAQNPAWEIGRSRISKLSIQRANDTEMLYSWDRGSDIPARDSEVEAILEYLKNALSRVLDELT
ncbi:MAG TPA: hypothetical protein VHD56_17490 [Tepidisphaeraceae bacterium]|jgi:hypothetical protein|nr:hypothetical protein [Tepidisphaeraceae bacterium]